MTKDAALAIRTLFVASLAVLVVWTSTWIAGSEKLRILNAVNDLELWLQVTETIRRIQPDVFRWSRSQVVDVESVPVSGPVSSANPCIEGRSIQVTVSWPAVLSYRLKLVPRADSPIARVSGGGDTLREYCIVSDPPCAGLSGYTAVISAPHNVAVVPGGLFLPPSKQPLHISHCVMFANAMCRPRRWDDLKVAFARLGFAGHPRELTRSSEAVSRVLSECAQFMSNSAVSVLGVQVGVPTFLVGVGVILGLISLELLGPLLRCSEAGAAQGVDSTWIFLTRTAHPVRRPVLEGVLMAISVAWGLSPIVLLMLEVASFEELQRFSRLGLAVGYLGLAFSSVTFCWTARVLQHARCWHPDEAEPAALAGAQSAISSPGASEMSPIVAAPCSEAARGEVASPAVVP